MNLYPVFSPSAGFGRVKNATSLHTGHWVTRLVAYLGAGLILAAAVVLSAWAAGNGMEDAMAALSWMLGIVFLALAVDNTSKRGAWQATTGVALMALGWMCSRIAPELGIPAALLASGWLLEATLFRVRN